MVERVVIDPTKNVLDLVNAESKYQDAMRAAEKTRTDDLARMREYYEGIIEGMRSKALETTSLLLASQLKETKLDLSERTSKLEQFRWESGGRSGGRGEIVAWIFSGVAMFGVIVGGVIALITKFS